jgi:shikimate dehydrogenase
MITKDTKIYGSFSKKAGNLGTKLFNLAFKYYGINAIYRSFSIDDIEDAVQAARTLKFSGFAVSMPFKFDVIKYVDDILDDVKVIGAANTVTNVNGKLIATNTDWVAVKEVIGSSYQALRDGMYILGNGGYAAAVRYAADKENIKHKTITRENWNELSELRDSYIFNCTPVENLYGHGIRESNTFIDCITTTKTGKDLSVRQAAMQFWLYTGELFPFKETV